MKLSTKIITSVLVLLVTGMGLASTFVSVHNVDTKQTAANSYVGEIKRDVLVGQTFSSNYDNLAAVSIYFNSFSAKDGNNKVRFHLRESISSIEDLRTGEVSVAELDDEGFYRFEFEPVADSKDNEYFFFVVSPESSSGNAVTAGANIHNQYRQGAAYVLRESGPADTDAEAVMSSLVASTDLAFKTYYFTTLRDAIINKTAEGVLFFMSTWQENLPWYVTWSKIIVPALLLISALILLRKKTYDQFLGRYSERRLTLVVLTLLLLSGLIMRLMYALELPVTADEGRYLYDAKRLTEGILAGGDAYVKAPLVIGWIALWQTFFYDDAVIVGRMSSIVISTLTIFPLYIMVKHLWNRRAGLIAAAVWSLSGAAVLYGIYIHTQPLAIFFAVSSIAVLCAALRKDSEHQQFHLMVLAGIFFALALLSRKSVMALSIIPLALIFIEAKSWRRLTYVVAYGIGSLLVLIPFMGVADMVYGDHGVWEAMGLNSIEDGLNIVRSMSGSKWYTDSVGNIVPLFRQALPLIGLFLIGLGITSEKFLRSAIKSVLNNSPWEPNTFIDHVLPKVMWAFPAIIYGIVWLFWLNNESEAFMISGANMLWIGFAITIGIFAIWPRPTEEKIVKKKYKAILPYSTQPNIPMPLQNKTENKEFNAIDALLTPTLIVPLWLLGLIVFYANWLKFNTDYIAEFIPPFIILASFGAAYVFDRLRRSPWLNHKLPGVVFLRFIIMFPVAVVILWGFIASNYATYMFDHTGEYSQSSLYDAAAWARVHIPFDEEIFTGAPIIPYLSGHRTALDISHTGWYSYKFTQSNSERLNTFLPATDELVKAFQEADWVLVENKTRLHLLQPYDVIERDLRENFLPIKTVENDDTPFVFYRRQ